MAALIAAIALVACGGGDDPAAPQDAREQAATETETETTPADLTDTSAKPVIPRPSGSPPDKLQVEDIVKGKGPAAKNGDTVTLDYVGTAFSTGEEFGSSWEGQALPPFVLGTGSVIKGWDRGIVGMRVGGRRKLVIPPEQAYGTQGQGPIGPNETLVFVVDLTRIG
ncbi:MAG: FKBP-type peptidyl-prolyl cis-trans isomerase [Thermoleophilaceae bacterium]|nr:FKBP-type peptidyl-prolyl cis-trans isomerase [Thermoleophilaceae bacterium]